MAHHRRLRAGDHTLAVTATERVDGDLHPQHVDAGVLARRQRRVTGVEWTMLDQRHGTTVVVATDEPWRPTAGVGDVVVAVDPTRPVGVWTADCAGLVLADRDGTMLVGAHAGWRGLAAGVVDVAIDAIERRGRTVGPAVVGPTIRACCYEFGGDDLAAVAAGLGVAAADLAGTTRGGTLGLDMAGAVVAAAARRGVEVEILGGCTGCDDRWFSHRVRGESARHGLVAWFEAGT